MDIFELTKQRALKDLNEMKKWEKEQKEKIKRILKKQGIELKLENIPEIIKLFEYNNITSLYPEEYPYCKNPCHNGYLNCFLCACPYYDLNIYEKKRILIGGCKINGNGKYTPYKDFQISVWDCSDCKINHTKKTIEFFLKKLIKSQNF